MAAQLVSYKDPAWDDIEAGVQQKLGLPPGLQASTRLNGERSNADQVSEAGARTVYQITPQTRKLALDKWGIDPYLSDQNAAEVNGLLLKDSLDRNGGDPALAIAEYHGGTDRKNWGPKTHAYVARVAGGLPAVVPDAGDAQPSTFDRVSAGMAKPSPSALSTVIDAYQSGRMSPEDAVAFESEVKAGSIVLPGGVSLKSAAPAADTEQQQQSAGAMLPDSVVQAYNSGRMTEQDRAQLDQAVKDGSVTLPQGATLQAPPERGFLGRIAESVTGADRHTATTDALPDWAGMPELNSLSLASAKTGLGTLLSNPGETAQIIKANFPDAQIRQDEKGNYVIRSAADGKEYAIKPGFQVSDIPRAIGALAAFTPAGRATSVAGAGLAAAGTQAAIEASQAATGGNFNPGDVLAAGAMGSGGQLAARALESGGNAARAALARVRGAPAAIEDPALAARQAAAAAPGEQFQPVGPTPEPIIVDSAGVARPAASPAQAPPAAPATPPTAAAPAVEPLAAEQLAETARKASAGGLGSKQAMNVLADQAMPDAATVSAAKRLGIENYLQPDHVTTNQAYRELAQAVKSIPGSEGRAAEIQGLDAVAQRANNLIDEIGGSTDVAAVSNTVKQRMQATQAELEQRSNKLYDQVRDAIPAKTPAPAQNTLAFLKQHADDVGGADRLLPTEKKLLSALSTSDENPLTYAYLDQTRKQIGQALRKASGPFADSESGLLKRLYSTLSEDQSAVATAAGAGDLYKAAQASVAVRKGLEDDLTSLFGRVLDGGIANDLAGSVRGLAQGDTSRFLRLIKAVPDDLRQHVVASGLASAFRTAGTRGPINFTTYAKWYEGLQRNRQAYSAIMANLPLSARKQLHALYQVSTGISAASRERITTGRIQAFTEGLKGTDTLMSNLYSTARRASVGLAAEAVTTPLGLPGSGIAAGIASALTKGKPNAMKAADALISSPEFIHMAQKGGNAAAKARRLAFSKPFDRYVRAVGNPRDMTNRERWILNAMQAQNNSSQTRQ